MRITSSHLSRRPRHICSGYLMKEYDTNKDGCIDFDEFREMMRDQTVNPTA